ncbi:MAG: hypothetical protein AB1646_20720 [Thermodesulfobacteriota bacterium]
MLAMDRNGDGSIDSGKELFGNETIMETGAKAENGFRALSELDSNGDGKIDATDEGFARLRVWKDVDGDGISFPDELYSLEDLGIESIGLNSTADPTVDPQGNTRTRVGASHWVDGTAGEVAEYGLFHQTMYTVAEDWVQVPDVILALPDLPGYGHVYDLHQAMARDTSGTLKGHVQAFGSATTRGERQTAMENILQVWTGSSNIPAANGREGLSGPRVGVLSALFGQSFFTSTGVVRAAWGPQFPRITKALSLLKPVLRPCTCQ